MKKQFAESAINTAIHFLQNPDTELSPGQRQDIVFALVVVRGAIPSCHVHQEILIAGCCCQCLTQQSM